MHNIQLVQIQPEERLAATSELNPASCLVTGCGEARGMGYWAATQVKGFSHEIFIAPEADVVFLTEGCTLIADSLNGTWQGDASSAGSETVARYQMDIMGTRETQSVLLMGVCAIKPIDGKIVQMTLWESDQSIVPLKRGNARGGKGLAVEPLGQGHIHRTKRRIKDGNKTGLITYRVNDREVPEEPDEGKLQVRFCEGAHSSFWEEVAMSSTRQKKFRSKVGTWWDGIYRGRMVTRRQILYLWLWWMTKRNKRIKQGTIRFITNFWEGSIKNLKIESFYSPVI